MNDPDKVGNEPIDLLDPSFVQNSEETQCFVPDVLQDKSTAEVTDFLTNELTAMRSTQSDVEQQTSDTACNTSPIEELKQDLLSSLCQVNRRSMLVHIALFSLDE
jgi:hypothetical protein